MDCRKKKKERELTKAVNYMYNENVRNTEKHTMFLKKMFCVLQVNNFFPHTFSDAVARRDPGRFMAMHERFASWAAMSKGDFSVSAKSTI